MPSLVVPAALRRGLVALAAVVVLALLLLSQSFGRAVPTNNYRPLITADPIVAGCYPLPGGATLEPLSYQVRWDEDVATPAGERRTLRGQYNLVDIDEATALLVAAFTEVGFAVTDRMDGAEDPQARYRKLEHPRTGQVVRINTSVLPDTSEETLVRGEFVLDLPVVALARPDDPICREPRHTKRWDEPEEVSR